MAGGHAERDSHPRYYYDDYPSDERHRERRSRHRKHRHRDEDEDDEAYLAAKRERRERRERRRVEEEQREAELELDALRRRREDYYSRPERERQRDAQRMAQEVVVERESKPRSGTRVRRDGTVKRKKVVREIVDDDRSDAYVYGRPKTGVVEEVTIKRSSARKRSDEGGSSSRTAQSPFSGSRSASVRDTPKLSRSTSAREPSRVYMASRPSLRRSSTVKIPQAPAAPVQRSNSISVRDPHHGSVQQYRRSTGGLLGALFRPPPPVVHKEIPRVQCVVCITDDLPATKTAKLGCGHRMCYSCLKRQFALSVDDPQHMPPRCCTADHIPLKYVERLFDDKFKRLWNKKFEEYTTGNRIYCPTKDCGEWIKPSKIRMDITYGRKYARCGRCGTKVCALCNSKFHTKRECPKDEETKRIVQMAKEKGWQKCYHCKTLVELKEGCNHMTCRCSAQFCMVCAAPWKTCNCPWFNYQHIADDDRLNDMRVPYDARQNVVEVIEMPEQSSPPLVRRVSTRARHRGGDLELDRADEALTAHLQAQLRLGSAPAPAPAPSDRDPAVQVYGVGNSVPHHMNDSYTVRPLATQAARTAVRNSTPRFFRRVSVREQVRPTPAPHPTQSVAASAMAGLKLDGSRRGANRVGTWLSHVQVDHDAVLTAPRDVEVDDWRIDGSMIGID